MAHELKSPLATVALYTNLLRRTLADEPVAVEQLDVIEDQTRRCLERIRAVMHSMNPDPARVAGTALTSLQPLVRAVVNDQLRRYAGAALAEVGARRASCLPKPFAAESSLDLACLLAGSP